MVATTIPLEHRVRVLKQVHKISRSLPPAGLRKLAGVMVEEHFPKGAEVVHEGDLADRLFVIARGKAEVTARGAKGSIHLTTLVPGDMFGELALLRAEHRRAATVTASAPLICLSLPQEVFAEFLKEHAEARLMLVMAGEATLMRHFVRVHYLYRLSFTSPRRERMFLSSLSFAITFLIVRGITLAIRSGHGPFHDVSSGGRHIHHLVWGIVLLLLVGYLWLLQLGTGINEPRRLMRETAIAYGIASALTLDEFALWLNLQDVYWTKEGRLSIDAVIAFGSLLSVGAWGGPFWRSLVRFLIATRRGQATV